MSFGPFPSPDERDRAHAHGMHPLEYLGWRDRLCADYASMLPSTSRLAGRCTRTVRAWMVPGSDAATIPEAA